MWFSLFSSMFYVQNIYELRIFVANDCENSAALCSTGLLMIPDDGLAVDNVLWQVELINHAQGNGPTAWLAVVHFPFDEESLHSILDSWSDSCSIGGRHPKYSGNCCFTSFPGLPRTNITSQFRVATCATHLASWSWDVSNLIRSKVANMTNDFFTKYWTYNLSKEVWKSNFRQYGQMKRRGGKSQIREEKRRESVRGKKRREEKRKRQRKEDAGLRKMRNVAIDCVFSNDLWLRVGSLKRRVRSHLARWEIKTCTPLWHEAHVEVKTYKADHSRSTFGSWDDEHMHAVVARSTCRSQKRKKRLRQLLEVEMMKKWMLLWCEAHFEVKMYKTHHCRTTFGSWDVEKAHAIVARSTFPSQNLKSTTCSDHFWTLRYRFAWQAQGILHLVKSEQNASGFCSSFKSVGRHGAFEEDLQRGIFRGKRSTRDMVSRDVSRSVRALISSEGCILKHQICRFAKMILRDRCSTLYDLASLFRGRRGTLGRWTGQITKRIGTRPSALHSIFHFWRKPRRIASFLMLSTWKIEEVSQNCFLFSRCQVQKLNKSCRIVALLMLSSSTNWGSLAK